VSVYIIIIKRFGYAYEIFRNYFVYLIILRLCRLLLYGNIISSLICICFGFLFINSLYPNVSGIDYYISDVGKIKITDSLFVLNLAECRCKLSDYYEYNIMYLLNLHKSTNLTIHIHTHYGR